MHCESGGAGNKKTLGGRSHWRRNVPGFFGLVVATGNPGLPAVGVVLGSLGLAAFCIGLVSAVVRFVAKRRLLPHFLLFLAVVGVALFVFHKHCFSLTYIRGAEEDPGNGRLWIDALKGFEGPVYYVGSEKDYSYFRVGDFFPARYKAPISKVHLPRTFELGKGTPYKVTAEMVLEY